MTLFEILPSRIVTSDKIMYLDISPYNKSEHLYNVVLLEGEEKLPRALLFSQTTISLDKQKINTLIKFFEDNLIYGSLFFKENKEMNIKQLLEQLLLEKESSNS